MAAKATDVERPLFEEASGILSATAASLGNDMVSFQVPCRVSLHLFRTPGAWCCQTLALGPLGERALARVRVRPRDVARAEATPVS